MRMMMERGAAPKPGKRGRAWLAALLLALFTLGPGMHAAAEVGTTTARVSFKEGDLSLIADPDGSGLDFDFGEHFLPTAAVAYPAENGESHILKVEDGRLNSGSWYVTVQLTSFTEAGGSLLVPEFEAAIRLKDPHVYNENSAVGTVGLTAGDDITVLSNNGEQLVMEADATLSRGVYAMEWADENVTLNIGDSQVYNLQLEAYTALVSWSLNLGPR